MILVTAAAFILFWLRDYWLLQLGPSRSIARRVWSYAALVTLAAVFVWLSARTDNPAQFFTPVASTPALIALFTFPALAAIVCFWMRRTGRYHLAWLAAMI